MKTVFLFEDALGEPERHEVEDVLAFLTSRFPAFPSTGRVYHREIVQTWDEELQVGDCTAVENAGDLPGPFHVAIYPAGPALVPIIIGAVSLAASLAMSFLLKPHVPTPALRNTQTSSPNNDLSDRQNTPRLNGRIPDILGQVRSTPDLIGAPYRTFVDHKELEFAFLAVGRGTHLIEDVKEGATLVSQIPGADEIVEVWGPNSLPPTEPHPLGTGTPQLVARSTGAAPRITALLRSAKRFDPVNGQVLSTLSGHGLTISIDPGQPGVGQDNYPGIYKPNILRIFNPDQETIAQWHPGDFLVIEGGNPWVAGGYMPDHFLDGTYTILSVSALLSAAGSSAPAPHIDIALAWSFDQVENDGTIPGAIFPQGRSIRIYTQSGSGLDQWVGPFTLDVDTLTSVYCNFVAPSGLYKDNGTSPVAFDIIVELELTPIDAAGNPRGAAELKRGTIVGSASSRSARALTLEFTPTFTGRCTARARRVTDADLSYEGTVVDEVKWRDIYAMSPVTVPHFGDLTTVYAATYVTGVGQLANTERKLNMLATRCIRRRGMGTVQPDGFSAELLPTKRGDDIFVHVSLDQKIGNRTFDELVLDSIYGATSSVEAYFGTAQAIEFCATLDKDNISYEDTAAMIAGVVFCTAYRQGSGIRLKAELATEDSTLLFNHRNKLPGSETRTVSFGLLNDNDGVEYTYVDPVDDAVMTLYLPAGRTAINPKKVESVGVRNPLQAHFQASRIWAKIQYQRVLTEFEATQEADLSVITDRILVADNTRTGTQDGEVVDFVGLTLTLSQEITFGTGKTYTIFLQLSDGTVDSMTVTAGPTSRQVVLARAPRNRLQAEPGLFAKTTCWIVPDDSPRERAFLLTEKTPQAGFTSIVKAVNYDARYYAADKDFAGGVISAGGTTGALPTVSFSSSATSGESGDSFVLTWSVTGAASVAIDHGVGSVAAIGSVSVSPTETTTYTLTATNPSGTVTATVAVTVGGEAPIDLAFDFGSTP